MDSIVPQKCCSKCKQFKPLSEEYFGLDKNTSDGFKRCCKACRHLAESPNTTFRGVRLSNKDIPEGHRRCSTCKQIKPATANYFDHRYNGLRSQCKECRYPPKPIDLIHQGQKHCPKCGVWFPATTEYFPRNHASKDGFYDRCKQCNNKPPKVNDVPEGYKRCGECKLLFPNSMEFFYSRRSHLTSQCKMCARKKTSEYGISRKELHSKQISPNYPTEKSCSQCKISFSTPENFFHTNKSTKDGLTGTCKVCGRKRTREYYRRPEKRELVVRNSSNRHARKKMASGTYTLQEKHDQYNRQKGKCYYCRQKVEWGKHHADHVVPLSRGGANDISNIVITCARCNLSKRNKLPHEFFEGGRLL